MVGVEGHRGRADGEYPVEGRVGVFEHGTVGLLKRALVHIEGSRGRPNGWRGEACEVESDPRQADRENKISI